MDHGAEPGTQRLLHRQPDATGAQEADKKDVTEIAGMWSDVDPRDDAGESWAAERERLMALADELHALETPPTFIVDSGSGLQPVWMLADPIEASDEYQQAAENLCKRIEAALGAKGTHNVDRLLRVPGTRNFPNAKKRALGRGETKSRLLRWTWRRYSWTELESLAEHLRCTPPRHAVPQAPPQPGALLGAVDLPQNAPKPLEAFRLAGLKAKHPAVFEVANYNNDQSSQDLALANVARHAGWSQTDIWRLIITVRNDEKAYRRDYIERTLALAWAQQPMAGDAAHGAEVAKSIIDQEAKKKRQRESSSKAWDDPIPLFAEHEQPAPYPIDALPQVVRNAVKSYQAFGQQPVEMVACSALATMSLACQALADVSRDGNLSGPCSLSLLNIAVSGERKTTCDTRLRRASRAWQKDRREEQAPAIKAARRRLELWQARHDGMLAKIKRLAGSLKSEDQTEREQLESKLLLSDAERPKVPPEIKLFHEDTSPERLAVNLADGWPSSSLWSDEGGLIIGSHAMSEDVAMRFLALLNRLWDGGDFDRQREVRTSAYISGRRFTVSLMLQPSVLAQLVAAGNGVARGVGALARLLIAWPSSTIGEREYRSGNLDSPELFAFDARIRQLLDLPMPLDEEGALCPPVLRLSPAAFEVWRDLHDDIERQLGRRGEFSELPDFGAKAAEQAARIACILHVFEHGPHGEIGPEMMLAGAQLAVWHLTETRRVFASIGHAGETSDAQLLLDWLQDQTEAPTLGHILRLAPLRLRDKTRRNAAVAILLEHGLARTEQRGGAEHLVINPKVRS